jgi:hypothetical protein
MKSNQGITGSLMGPLLRVVLASQPPALSFSTCRDAMCALHLPKPQIIGT